MHTDALTHTFTEVPSHCTAAAQVPGQLRCMALAGPWRAMHLKCVAFCCMHWSVADPSTIQKGAAWLGCKERCDVTSFFVAWMTSRMHARFKMPALEIRGMHASTSDCTCPMAFLFVIQPLCFPSFSSFFRLMCRPPSLALSPCACWWCTFGQLSSAPVSNVV